MRTATAKKLVRGAGLTFSTQDERFYSIFAGNFWFFGESRLFPSRARFYIIQGDDQQKEKLNQLSNYLKSLGYETKIHSNCVEIMNLNSYGELS